MEKYKFYKKVEPVTFNFEELLSYIILPLIIASYISYPILYFLGTGATVIFNVILAFIATYFYKGLQRSISILSNRNNIEFESVFFRFVSFLIVLTVLLIANFGFYLLVLYQKNNEFNTLYFYCWLLIVFGLPLFYYIKKLSYHYYIKTYQTAEFITVILDINCDLKLFISIDNIQFVNRVNRNSSDIKIKNNIKHYSHKEFLAMNTKTRKYYANKKSFRELVQIPLHANLLILSWFSFVEDKYYSVKIPFSLVKDILKKDESQSSNLKVCSNEIMTLQLNVFKNGGIQLFDNHDIVIDCPESSESLINDEYKKMKFGLM